MTRSRSLLVYWVLGLTAVGALAVCVLRDDCTLLTPDQRAFRHYEAEEYEAALEDQISAEEMNLVMGGNIMRLFGIA